MKKLILMLIIVMLAITAYSQKYFVSINYGLYKNYVNFGVSFNMGEVVESSFTYGESLGVYVEGYYGRAQVRLHRYQVYKSTSPTYDISGTLLLPFQNLERGVYKAELLINGKWEAEIFFEII